MLHRLWRLYVLSIMLVAPHVAQGQIQLAPDGGVVLGGSGTRVSAAGDNQEAKLAVRCAGDNGCGASNYYTVRTGVKAEADGAYHNQGIVGRATGGYSNYGIYGYAGGGSHDYAGYFDGTVYSTGTYQGSDWRLKRNIRPLASRGSMLAQIVRLQPRVYAYDRAAEHGRRHLPEGEHMGLIAQEVEDVFPGIVREVVPPGAAASAGDAEPETFKAVNYTELIPVLIQAIQEQQARIEALEEALSER